MYKLKETLKKNELLVKTIKWILNWLRYSIYPVLLKSSNINSSRPKSNVLNDKYREGGKVVISLTSFPKRIHFAHKSIQSIMNQTYKPDLILLCLSQTEFPKKEEDLPNNLLVLTNYGLKIVWTTDNLRSYKKLIPALQLYPKDIIVTADDDLYYPVDWLDNLIASYKQHPEDIHCHLITRISYENKKLKVVPRSEKYINQASYNNKILGGSGTLYPPGTLSEEILNIEKFMKLAPTSDDLWFWGAALKNRTKIRWISNHMKKIYHVEWSQEAHTLTSVNDKGEKYFNKHIINVVNYFNISKLL